MQRLKASTAPRQRTLEAEDEEKKYQKLFFLPDSAISFNVFLMENSQRKYIERFSKEQL